MIDNKKMPRALDWDRMVKRNAQLLTIANDSDSDSEFSDVDDSLYTLLQRTGRDTKQAKHATESSERHVRVKTPAEELVEANDVSLYWDTTTPEYLNEREKEKEEQSKERSEVSTDIHEECKEEIKDLKEMIDTIRRERDTAVENLHTAQIENAGLRAERDMMKPFYDRVVDKVSQWLAPEGTPSGTESWQAESWQSDHFW